MLLLDPASLRSMAVSQGVAPKRVSEPGKLSMQIHVGSGRPLFQDSGLPLNRGMLEPKVQAAAPQWIANPANLVRGQHDKRLAPRFDRADLGDGDLPVTQDFKDFASNSSPTLSISSISRTHGFSHRSARSSGPSWKNSSVWRSRRRDAHSAPEAAPCVFR